MVHNTIAHHTLTDTQPVPKQQIGSLLGNFHSLYSGNDILWKGISLGPDQVSSPGHAASQLLVQLLTGRAGDMENP